MSKLLVLTFLFAPAELPWKRLSVHLSGCLAGLPCFQVGMYQVLGLLPAAEFRESGKTLGPCSVIQQMMGISPKPGVRGGQANPGGPDLEAANVQALLGMGVLHGNDCVVLWATLV